MAVGGGTKVVQVTNIAPQATKDQMQTLFGYLGKIEDIRLYPTIRDVSCPVQSRICYIKFIDSVTVGIAQHMTNTVFIDRALIVIPIQNGDIPDEYYALEMTKNGAIVPGLCPQEPKLPPNVVNTVLGTGSDQVIVTTDPQLEVNALSSYPALPANYDSCKIEEIRRTVLLPNVDTTSLTADDVIAFFKPAGEVKYVRFCSRNSDSSQHILVEFSDQPSIIEALKLSGNELKGKQVTVHHSLQAIVKPQAKSNEAAQREIEEAMSRVKEAQSLISAAIDPVIGMLSKDKRSSRRSRSRSRGRRRRSRTRSPSRRSRSRHRKRSSSRSRRSRSRDRRRRSRSRRSTSRSRRSRSRSIRSRRSRSSRSRSKSHASKSSRKENRRTRDRSRDKASSRDKDRERSRDKERERSREKERDRERSRDDRERSRDNRERSRDDRDRSRDEVERTRDRRSKDKVRESKEKRGDSLEKERVVEEKKRTARSCSRYRSRSRERRNKRDRRRSRSRTSRKRSPTPKKHTKRSRSRSKDHVRKKDRKERKERSASRSKVPRNYDEEEKGFDSEKRSSNENDLIHMDKDSSEKSDNMDISNSP